MITHGLSGCIDSSLVGPRGEAAVRKSSLRDDARRSRQREVSQTRKSHPESRVEADAPITAAFATFSSNELDKPTKGAKSRGETCKHACVD